MEAYEVEEEAGDRSIVDSEPDAQDEGAGKEEQCEYVFNKNTKNHIILPAIVSADEGEEQNLF